MREMLAHDADYPIPPTVDPRGSPVVGEAVRRRMINAPRVESRGARDGNRPSRSASGARTIVAVLKLMVWQFDEGVPLLDNLPRDIAEGGKLLP